MTEFFYDYLLPQALTFGMTAKEFWEDDPNLLWAYRKSFFDKVKINNEQINYNSWLQGAYFYDAISTALYNGFGRKQGAPALSYIEEPYEFNKEKREKKEVNKREQDIKAQLKRSRNILENRSEHKGQIIK